MLRTPILLTFLIALGGCAHLGPGSIKGNRLDYNMAIQQTNDQELLLNLVRLKYRDRLYFMNVERVVSALEFNRSVGVGATFPPGVDPTVSLGPIAAAYNEKPSIFYTPLEGDKFVRQMLTPISLETILLLTRSGWSSERVLLQTVQTMNQLKNAPSASGPTPDYEPEFREFREAVRALRSLQTRGLVSFGRDAGERGDYELRIASDAANDADAVRFRSLLNLDPALTRYRVFVGYGAPDRQSIAVTTRAMTGVLYYLSQGVRAPKADEEMGRVTRTLTASGEYFDWSGMLEDVLRIESAPTQPENAAVSVPYRGGWFYIRDADLQSKTTFSLLAQLITLQAGPAVAGGAALSFSVGGR
ncbi:MAG: hypothetical protein PHD37_04135 [Gallionellaceae bacterium]|nr:hypothetical protein [Gallionellaceae bacterium]